MINTMKRFSLQNGREIKLRIGIAVGPLVAGVIGLSRPKVQFRT
jgi:class 3 adenylate cyclase